MVKINIGAALSRAWCQGSQEALSAGGDHYGVLDLAMQRVHETAVHRLRLMGATGRSVRNHNHMREAEIIANTPGGPVTLAAMRADLAAWAFARAWYCSPTRRSVRSAG